MMCHANTNEHLYDDIALWEKTEGIKLKTLKFFTQFTFNVD